MLPGPGQCYMVPDNTVTRSRHPVSRTCPQENSPDHGQCYLVLDNFTWSITTQCGPGQYYLVLSRRATLASSLNIGCAIYNTTNAESITDLGPMLLNCFIFQYDIARMKTTANSGRVQKWKKIRAGGSHIIMNGEALEISTQEKYLGDLIHEDGTAASILTIINKRMKVLTGK